MKVIYNNIIPFKGYKAINIFGLVFVRKGAKFTEVDYNHEHIHSKQMAEMLWIFFYLWYGIEYLIILCFAKWNKQNERYHDVSFEEEAYNNDSNLDYISTRKHYAWFKYIKLRSYKK